MRVRNFNCSVVSDVLGYQPKQDDLPSLQMAETLNTSQQMYFQDLTQNRLFHKSLQVYIWDDTSNVIHDTY